MTKAKMTSRGAANGGLSDDPETGTWSPQTKTKHKRSETASASSVSTTASEKTARTKPLISATTKTATPKPPRQTKAALLRARLCEPGGVSVAALMAATRWQAHTLRAALSGLRKEGLVLSRRREGEDTVYAIEPGGSVEAQVSDIGAPSSSSDEHPADSLGHVLTIKDASDAPASLPVPADRAMA